jgi:hypothetical protein
MPYVLFFVLSCVLLVMFLGGVAWSHKAEQEALNAKFPPKEDTNES